MNNAELFHRWANRVKEHGKSGNVFYGGPILYSYGHHFPLAVLTGKTDAQDREIALVNARSYSMTTAHHKLQAVRASSHMRHIYVPRPTDPSEDENLDYLNDQTKAACERLKGIRSAVFYSERAARECVDTAKLYRKTFLKGRGHVVPLPKDFDAILTAARERETRHNTPPTAEQLAKRDKDRIRRDEKRETERQARRDKELKDAEQAVIRWRDGESVYLPWELPCMLRVKPSDPDVCETSLRAEVPLTHARRLYGLILGIMAKGEDWETNGHTIPVGVYKVDRITKEGTLKAGCHTISFEEIDRFAGERGWKS